MYSSININELPSELVLQILLHIPTLSLLPHATISRRFHDLIARVIRLRLCAAATAITHHTLLLECYEPAARLTEPRMDCMYLDSPGLEHVEEGDDAPGAQFRRFKAIYSRFRPYREENTKPRMWKHPAGDVPGTRTFANTNGVNLAQLQLRQNQALAQAQADEVVRISSSDSSISVESNATKYSTSVEPEPDNDKVSPTTTLPPLVAQLLHLDSWQPFTQLVVGITLKMGPPKGLFARILTVHDGLLRIFRKHLAEMCTQGSNDAQNPAKSLEELLNQSGVAKEDMKHSSTSAGESVTDGILWLTRRLVGIKFRVYERKWPRRNTPILVEADEELPVTYVIEYEELLVQTKLLMDRYEQFRNSKEEIHNKAIVWGVFS